MVTTKTINRANPLEKPPLPGNQNKPVKVYFGVFFDGTFNHRGHAEIGERYRAFIEKKGFLKNIEDKEEQIKKITGYSDLQPQKVDRTNIDILEANHNNEKEADCASVSIYIEGAGTHEDISKREDWEAAAVGTGETGILKKVERAIGLIPSKIKQLAIQNQKFDLYFNVFGFSRGASSARHFVWKITQESSPTIQNLSPTIQKLKSQFKNLSDVKINFVGLYDTVSSYKLPFDNDVKELHLDDITKVEKVLHICAADEFRKNFARINIKSALKAGNGTEIVIPGVHADIGGSAIKEKYTVILGTRYPIESPTSDSWQWLPYHINYIKDEKGNLKELDRKIPDPISSGARLEELNVSSLQRLGWIAEDAIDENRLEGRNIKEIKHSYKKSLDSVSFSNYVKKGYGYVSLYLMITGAHKKQPKMFDEASIKNERKLPDEKVIHKIKKRGEECIMNDQSKDIYKEISNEEYKFLRSNYLHFSSDQKDAIKYLVNSPNYKNGVLKREVYDG